MALDAQPERAVKDDEPAGACEAIDGEAKGTSPAPEPRRVLSPALVALPGLLERLAKLTGIALDPIDIATLGTTSSPSGYGLMPEHVMEAVTELLEKIRDGGCVPSKDDPGAKWSARSLRGHVGSFFRAKRDRLARGESGVAEQARLRREAAEREAAHERRKAREAREWRERRSAEKSGEPEKATGEAAERSHVPAPPWLREQVIAGLRRALGSCGDVARGAELREEIARLEAERGPP